jgi:hypothetical protein
MALDEKIAELNPHCRGSVKLYLDFTRVLRTRAGDLQSLHGNSESCDDRGIMLNKKDYITVCLVTGSQVT